MMRTNPHAVVALGFATTVAMWAVGYVGRMPPGSLPSAVLGVTMLACLVAGGVVGGRTAPGGWRAGAGVVVVASLLNMLILGSLLAGDRPNVIAPGAIWWVPGSLLAGGVLGAAGGWFGARRAAVREARTWSFTFAITAATAALLQLAIGGLVTSHGAGLAVVDWPNSFGTNMFLYPLGRMTGGVYYEHAHRLFGSLLGLTTLALAVHLQRTDRRGWCRAAGWIAFLAVVVQGVLGGLRVTGHFTLSTSPSDTAPSLLLAAVHGVGGQVFFALLVAIAVWVSESWREARPAGEAALRRRPDVVAVRALALMLLAQLALGASQRHFSRGLLVHVTFATAVLAVAVVVGARLWGLGRSFAPLPRVGATLIAAVCGQVLLGFAALAAVSGDGVATAPWQVAARTAHQAAGAVLLAVVTVALVGTSRLFGRSRPAGG